MNKFFLKEINLISFSERKAKSVKFEANKNIIIGPNTTGKSCLIKSIYNTFGAEPKKMHPDWIKAKVSSLVKFHLLGEDYSMLKHGHLYGIFDSKDNLLDSFESITKELAPYFSEKFNFKIRITDRQGNPSVLTPPYFFLPFYINQDSSWETNWSSFEKLTQFGNWRTPIVEYHTGIKGNDYYETKIELDKIRQEIKDIEKELLVIKKVLRDLREKLNHAEFNIDMNVFKNEVQNLIQKCDLINKKQNRYRANILRLNNDSFRVTNQIVITEKTLNEIRKDYQFAIEALKGEPIECPTCGTLHENSFTDRLSIANDEERCHELLQELRQELHNINLKIGLERNRLTSTQEELNTLNEILETKKEKIILKDIIDSQGRSEVKLLFDKEISSLNQLMIKKHRKEIALEKKLKGLTNKKVKDKIVKYYNELMKEYLADLEVLNLKPESYSKITSTINESGSALPRALMAYYYSILNTIKKYGTSIFCPIVIDSPNQQGQDPVNLPKIIRFIDKHQPKDTQLIIGLEDFAGVKIDGKIIKLENKYSLLNKESFEESMVLFRPYINKISEIRKGLFA